MHPVFTAKTLLLSFLCSCIVVPALSQKNAIKGIVADTSENKKLQYAIVALIDLHDSTLYRSIRTNEEGKFELTKIAPGNYMLMISYPKMADYLQSLAVKENSTIDLALIPMISKADLLEEVIVRAGVPVRMRGDTLEYTADSFAVKPGSNVEELLKRLPGIRVEKDGKIFAQGQEVKKMLVDGDEFFSDDPALAAEYLQADAVEKVQVFDKKSDQAEFTGIDDGQRTKTINLKLKKNRRNGYFGKLSAGGDGKQYYNHDAMGALFNGSQKISVFGVASKTGRQDFSFDDMSKFVNLELEHIDDGSGGMYLTNFEYEGDTYVGMGLPSVLSGGAHYSNKWNSDKQKLYLNYRTRRIDATGWSNGNSYTVLPGGNAFSNKYDQTEKSYSFRQKVNGSLALALDSFSVLKVVVNGGLSGNNNYNSNFSESSNEKGFLVNNSRHISSGVTDTRSFGSNINYRRKFRKEGRTLSLVFQQDYNNRLNDNYDSTQNNYYDPASGIYSSSDSLNQLQRSNTSGESYGIKGTYTDKIGKNWLWSAEYGFKTTLSGNLFSTLNGHNGKFEERIDSLSNDYDFTVNSHITGAAISYNTKPFIVTIGSKVFISELRQVNNDPHEEKRRSFINFAPQFNLNYKIKQNTSLSIRYNGETFQPSVEQLQPLRRSSNRLFVQIGNPDLKPGFSHHANLSFNKYNWTNGTYFYGGINGSYIDNAVTARTFTDAQNRTTSQYINLDGLVTMNGYMMYGWQYKKLNLKPSINFNFGRNGSFTIQNDKKLKNESVNLSAAFSLNHDWEKVMTTGYSGTITYNVGWSDIPGYQSQRVLTHAHGINNTFYLPKKLELGSDCNFSFQPKNSSFNTNFNIITWNAWLQRKFLKNDRGVIRLSVNDILNNNTGYQRNVFGNTVSESNRLVIKRYWLLTFTWNFTKSIK